MRIVMSTDKEHGAWNLSARFFFFGLVLDRAWKEKKSSGYQGTSGYISRDSNGRSSFRDFFHLAYECNYLTVLVKVIGSLSNHDYDGNKTPTNLHIWQWKTVFLHALHLHFSSYVLVLSMTWNDPFCSCVDDVSIWWQMFKCCLLMSQPLVPI